MANLIGHSLGRYHILEQLGEGGMATVYKAYDTRLENDVAVKVIRTENLAPSILEHSLKRFEREAKALAKLTHANIVNILDYGEYEGKPYLVMPYLPGGTLKQKLQGKPMQYQEAARLLIPIAKALAYAHQQGMVHRDVKPANILITQSGDPMLTDFGVAKIIDDEATMDLTGTSAAVGTPEYMAPEQITSKTVDHRADIYALGVVYYEMVTGRKPYTADTPMAVLFKHASEPLPRPKQFISSLPDEVEYILFKALAKNPQDRYPDAVLFANALEKLIITNHPESIPIEQPAKAKSGSVKNQDKFMAEKQTISQSNPGQSASSNSNPLSVSIKTAFPFSKRLAWGLVFFGVIGAAFWIGSLQRTTLPPTDSQAPVTVPATISNTISDAVPTIDPLTDLIASCRAEGMLTIIATPASWANYGEIFSIFEARSGVKINSLDENSGSADELAAIEANKGNTGPQSPDVVDVGYSFGQQGIDGGYYQAYKVSNWDKIPDTVLGLPAKDPNGLWTGGYYGVMVFEVNTDVIENIPQNWSDLLKSEYKDRIALAGDPRTSNQASQAVIAAALANGGSFDNVQPGMDFFKQLNDAGNFVPLIANLETVAQGTTPIVLLWDYNANDHKDILSGNPSIEIVYPNPTVASMYVQAISAYAPHPNCAKLWMEVLHSDAGQLAWMKGYAHGVNLTDMEDRGVIPAELKVKLPYSTVFASAVSPSPDQLTLARDAINNDWVSIVGVDYK